MLATGCAPALDWREARADEAGATVLMPCRPVRQQRTVPLAGGPVTMVLQVCDAGRASWALAHVDLGDPARVNAALAALADAVHTNLGATRAAGQTASVPGATPYASAGRFRTRGRAPDGRALESGTLVFARGTWVVQATVIGERLADAEVDTFLSSARAAP